MYRPYRRGFLTIAQNPCHECGRPPSLCLGWRWTPAQARSRLCNRCQLTAINRRRPHQLKAIRLVHAAIARGDIPPARKLNCADCGNDAFDYDHRDYADPLNVDPVCRGCNIRRGYALVTGLPGCAGRMPVTRILPRRRTSSLYRPALDFTDAAHAA